MRDERENSKPLTALNFMFLEYVAEMKKIPESKVQKSKETELRLLTTATPPTPTTYFFCYC